MNRNIQQLAQITQDIQHEFFFMFQRPLSIGSDPFHPIRGGVCHGLVQLARRWLSGVDIANTLCLRTESTERFYLPLLVGWVKPGKNLWNEKTDRGSATTASPQSVSIACQNKAALPVVLCWVQL